MKHLFVALCLTGCTALAKVPLKAARIVDPAPRISIQPSCLALIGDHFPDIVRQASAYWEARGARRIILSDSITAAPFRCRTGWPEERIKSLIEKGHLRPDQDPDFIMGIGSKNQVEILVIPVVKEDPEACRPGVDYLLSTLVIHELGHFHYGTGHSDDPTDVMWPNLNKYSCDVRE